MICLRNHLLSCLAALALTGVGCGDDAAGGSGGGLGPEPGGGAGVGQGGAQDFGLFREILLEGDIPGPDTIDDLGFFAEHKIELPAPDCGEDVCIHGMLGVMGNMISGSNCTMILVGMNTPIDPAQLERPPLHLAISIDLSTSMQGGPIERVREGLTAMRESFVPGDRVTLIGFSDTAEVLAEYIDPASQAYADTVAALEVVGATNIYSGLRVAYERVDAHAQDGWQNRVLLVSDGVANAGIASPDKIEGLAAAWSDLGYGLTTIGIGDNFDVDLMRDLAELGSGSFYYVEDLTALQEVFVEEAQAFTIPLAEDVRIAASVSAGYDLRRIYGTRQASAWGNEATIEIPILQIAHRESADDNETGRRGGGGAILLELLPTGEDPAQVGSLDFEYAVPVSGELVTQSVAISSPLGPWETPADGFFSDASVAKGFVMLNLYVGFEMAAERALVGDYDGAVSILLPLSIAVEAWLEDNPDADIEDDLFYVGLFLDNLESGGVVVPNVPTSVPPEPWPND